MGDERHGEILPHPYCDFCGEFFFNDLAFFNHLSREHLTCHLCGDQHKNVYYNAYDNLETHFRLTHFLCPYEICKAKCYVAFKTEDELQTHIEIEHQGGAAASKGKVKANALLGFSQAAKSDSDDERDDNNRGGRGKGRGGRGRGDKNDRTRVEIKDKEGIDFNYYFS